MFFKSELNGVEERQISEAAAVQQSTPLGRQLTKKKDNSFAES